MTNVTRMNAEAKIEMTQDVPVVGNYDVVVCGGGPAGFIAATASAREGARTAIIEQYGFFGGMATAGFVNPISVFSYNGGQVTGGIPWEFVNRLKDCGGAEIESPLANVAFEPDRTENGPGGRCGHIHALIPERMREGREPCDARHHRQQERGGGPWIQDIH